MADVAGRQDGTVGPKLHALANAAVDRDPEWHPEQAVAEKR